MWTFLAVSLSHNDEGCAYSNELISFCLMKLLAKKAQAEVGGESSMSNNQRVEGGKSAHQPALPPMSWKIVALMALQGLRLS